MEVIDYAKKTHGPFPIQGPEVPTGIFVDAGDSIRTISTGTVNFCIINPLGPTRDADGETDYETPRNYPAPGLKKNSLICRIGNRYYQGGIDKTFTVGESGEVILRANDNFIDDNDKEWQVTIEHSYKSNEYLLYSVLEKIAERRVTKEEYDEVYNTIKSKLRTA